MTKEVMSEAFVVTGYAAQEPGIGHPHPVPRFVNPTWIATYAGKIALYDLDAGRDVSPCVGYDLNMTPNEAYVATDNPNVTNTIKGRFEARWI